jgi:DNA modification methylase
MTLHCGDSLAYLQTLPDNSVDAVVTDPPYGLGTPPDPATVLAAWLDTGHHEVKGGGFMGKAWDAFVPQPAFWKEVYRVLKPGGHCVAFFGTRTFDWGVMAMRLAGFEVRTQLTWVYGSGFPKGNDIGRAIDQSRGGVGEWNVSDDDIDWLGTPNEHIQQHRASVKDRGTSNPVIYTPADPEAAQWQGWNTQLKPAHEPICLARKPCSEPTVAANVLKWRTGALNIGACRIPGADSSWERSANGGDAGMWSGKKRIEQHGTTEGRYPATVLHDGSDAVTAEFPVTAPSPTKTVQGRRSTANVLPNFTDCIREVPCIGDSGSASRYFTSAPYEPGELDSLVPFLYCAKASTAERNAGVYGDGVYGDGVYGDGAGGVQGRSQMPRRNHHATVKPITLMEWLCQLVTPPGGTILDPFMGSGTTGIAAERHGFNFIGSEMSAEYHALATQRTDYWRGRATPPAPKQADTPNAQTLF